MERFHFERKINQATVSGTLISVLLSKAGALGQTLGTLTNNLITSGYSREMETEADMEALKLMRKASYDPNGALIVFDTFMRLNKGKYKIFPTHPKASDRYNNVIAWMIQEKIAIHEPVQKETDKTLAKESTANKQTAQNEEDVQLPGSIVKNSSQIFTPVDSKLPTVNYKEISDEQLKQGEYNHEWEENIKRDISKYYGKNFLSTQEDGEIAKVFTNIRSQSEIKADSLVLVFLLDSSWTYEKFSEYLEKDVFPSIKGVDSFVHVGISVRHKLADSQHIVIVFK
jgi:hypothetical protein